VPSLQGIEVLIATVEAGSFAAAARRVGVTPSAVSRRVANLEQELGVVLFERTTRSLHLTDDGQAFHERCLRIVEELDEAKSAIARSTKRPSGTLRVDAPNAIARSILAPHLGTFLDRYPQIRLDLSLRDQLVDPAAEGLDVLVRIGALGDSNLIARKLGASRIIHVAAPTYLARRGTLRRPTDLAKHACLGYLRDRRAAPFNFVEGERVTAVEIEGPFNANDADVLLQLALAGQGVVALFDFVARDSLKSGALVEVLAEHPSTIWPIHALYLRNRHLLPKVSVFLEFLAELFRSRASRPHRDKRSPAARVKASRG
jgi:DNA-binding transcriptional LysR family regulator